MNRTTIAMAGVALFLAGCNDCITLKNEGIKTSLPALVELSFQARDCKGKPITSVSCDTLVFAQDGEPLSTLEAASGAVEVDQTYQSDALLLLDLSGSVITNDFPVLKEASVQFVDSVLGPTPDGRTRVAVYGFDGKATPTKIIDYSSDRAAIADSINRLVCPGPACDDTTTNLNGAVRIAAGIAAQHLKDLKAANSALNVGGALTIFSDGTDRAQRETTETAQSAVDAADEAGVAVFVVGVGQEANNDVLKKLAKKGFFPASGFAQLGAAFSLVAAEIRAEASSHFVAKMCSSVRNAASHEFTITLKHQGETGSLTGKFSSSGFAGGCRLTNQCAGP